MINMKYEIIECSIDEETGIPNKDELKKLNGCENLILLKRSEEPYWGEVRIQVKESYVFVCSKKR